MRTKNLVFFLSFVFWAINITFGQETDKILTAESYSLQLYNEGNWTALLEYGTETIKKGEGFSVLKMRTAYAAFMLKNYSKSLKYYEEVYKEDELNFSALYYCYLNNLYLNNTAATRFYGSKLSAEIKKYARLQPIKISEIGFEYSYKRPNVSSRGDAQYTLLSINTQLGYKLELQQGVAMFNQIINEPNFINVSNNTNIDIQQREYFAKIIYTPLSNFNAIGGFHYIYTPFNNFEYNNTVAFGGLKYTTPNIHFQTMTFFANITEKNYTQYDFSVSTYPLGNTNLYTISKVMFADNALFTQVVGGKIFKKTWIESNITLGEYVWLIDKDGLYLINDIDTKKFKLGASIYTMINNKLLISLNYNFEQKETYQTNINFNQQSTTINLTWKN
jgi:hypothetical protein